jgi:hypothetical protein
VPKAKFILLIGAGSCNFAGADGIYDTTTNPRCWAWGTGDCTDYWGTQQWVPLADHIWPNTSGGDGMVPLVKEMAKRYPDYYFGAIQWSRAGAGLRCAGADLGMMPSNNRGYKTLMNNLLLLAPNVTVGFIFAQFDALEAVSAQQYQDSYANDFKTVIDSMRAGVSLTPDKFPALVMEFGANYTGSYAITTAGGARVAAQILSIPSKLSYSATVSTVGLPVFSQHHFTGATWALLASRAVDTLQSKNWLYWANSTLVANSRGPVAMAPLCSAGNGSLTISTPGAQDIFATLTRLDGSLSRRLSLQGATSSHVTNLTPGMYLVDISENGIRHLEAVAVR